MIRTSKVIQRRFPIPKTAGCDTSIAKNWRPIVLSSTFSKLLELFVLDECHNHQFSDLQFGFITGRGTETATALINDVISYNNVRGSTVYTCSLDAEGAFDAIPHCVLFEKAAKVLPDDCWRVMLAWYSKLHVRIKWQNKLSSIVDVSIGTRQGGLSSPFLFNIFYQDLIELLNNTKRGITINNANYNVFCYADDIMLTSLTNTGLQYLIDIANTYITSHGLRFNPSKTICTSFGSCQLVNPPSWNLNNTMLKISEEVTYLGTVLSNKPAKHFATKISGARRAFYGLQGSGLCRGGVKPYTAAHIYNTAIKPILKYGCATINTNGDKLIKDLEKCQGMLIKSALGLSKYSRNTHLLRALNITQIKYTIMHEQMSILKRSLIGTSRARSFYIYMLHQNEQCDNSLVSRVSHVCNTFSFSFIKYIFDDSYARHCKRTLSAIPSDGMTDTLRFLLHNYSHEDKSLVELLTKSF